jgi:hypothetical protein
MAPGTGKKHPQPLSPFCFKPKAYLLQASSSLQFGSRSQLAFAMGGEGLAVRQKVTGASQIPKTKNWTFRPHDFPLAKKRLFDLQWRDQLPKG